MISIALPDLDFSMGECGWLSTYMIPEFLAIHHTSRRYICPLLFRPTWDTHQRCRYISYYLRGCGEVILVQALQNLESSGLIQQPKVAQDKRLTTTVPERRPISYHKIVLPKPCTPQFWNSCFCQIFDFFVAFCRGHQDIP